MGAEPRGIVVADLRCQRDEKQGYALYLPSNYSADKRWPVLMAFDPRARGVTAVERFAEAAENFGWIVAGSNNSRNGSWEQSAAALAAMSQDLFERFTIDEKRIYVAGMSGGARVAFQIALGTGKVAGVIASSAGFPEGKAREKVPFPVFGTAGREDFNWLEMRELDRMLKTRHRVRIFEGGHVWLSKELATEAVEWMELEAMRTGLKTKDAVSIDRLMAKRKAAAALMQGKDAYDEIRGMGLDFADLHSEAGEFSAQARRMERDKVVKAALKGESQEMELELQRRREVMEGEAGLGDPARRRASLELLREKLSRLAGQAKLENDSVERRVARRILRGLSAGGASTDPQYRKLLDELGLAGRPILKP